MAVRLRCSPTLGNGLDPAMTLTVGIRHSGRDTQRLNVRNMYLPTGERPDEISDICR